MSAPTIRKTPPGDRQYATYRHEILLANQKVGTFTGYSKFKGNDEANDKAKLLLDYISRIVRNGYLLKSYEISFYTNKNFGNDYDDLLVQLYPHTFEVHGAAKLNIGLTHFLKTLYETIKAHGAAAATEQSKSMVTYTKKPSIDQLFRFDKDRFPNHEALAAFCKQCIAEGQNRNRVEGYYYKCMEIFPHTKIQKPSPSPDQQNYQANLTKLTQKFSAK